MFIANLLTTVEIGRENNPLKYAPIAQTMTQ
jgi:hypothetical protein